MATLSAKGPAAPVVVWERYADIAQWAHWAPQIARVEAGAERIAPGVTGRVYGPVRTFVDFAVDTVDEDERRWSWTVTRFHVSVRLHHVVRAHPAGSATSLTMDGALPLLVGYAPIAQIALRRLVSG